MNLRFTALVNAVYEFFKNFDYPHLNAMLADWPPAISLTRSVIAGDLPVLLSLARRQPYREIKNLLK
jgi:hypothetical protein